ncbi:unnamed protein product [Alternaria sp. RS040]
MSSSSLRVGVIGPAGFGGSYLCVELLNRGHTVFGISRNPEKLGKHPRYVPRPVDIDQVSTEELAKQFEGIDVLVSEFGPHTAAYMEERLGIMGTSLRRYREARLAESSGRATEEDKTVIADYEKQIRVKDNASDFIKAGRTAYMFFEDRKTFNWSFVSPSALYRPGKRTGKYEISVDDMVLVGAQQEGKDVFEGRLTGISVADMAIAIADEIEQRKLVWKHWSASGDISEDVPAPAYVGLDAVEGGSR